MKDKTEMKAYFGIIASKIRLLGVKIKNRECENDLDKIITERKKLISKLYNASFGTFIVVLTWKCIEYIFSFKLLSMISGILSLFFAWGILIVSYKIYSINLDKRIDKAKRRINYLEKETKDTDKYQENLEEATIFKLK